MAHCSKNGDWIGQVARSVVMILLLGLLLPQVRQALSAIGFIAISMLGLVVVGWIGFGVYKIARPLQRAGAVERNIGCKASVIAANDNLTQPESATGLVAQLRSIDWFQFEKLVGLVYRNLGYTVTRRGGANPDGGIDLVFEKNGQRSAVQCKQWKTWNVGVKAVREFLGALTDAGIQKGVFITLCGYTGEARRLAEKHGIEIVNEAGLAKMLETTGARFDPEALAILNDSMKFCPKCENEMVLRTARRGAGAGRQFWGCSTFPRCQFTMQVSHSKHHDSCAPPSALSPSSRSH